jgi:predicted TIM-barrel fold metal-dependent hydrolase
MIPDFYRAEVYEAGSGPAIGRYPDWSPEAVLESMDEGGVEVAILSLAQPGVQFCDASRAAALARRCNDYAADIERRWPSRFGGFAVVPMGTMDEAQDEITHALDELELDGVCLFASYGERFLGDSVFDPVLECLDQRDAIVFVHPGLHPSSRNLLPWPGFVMEYPFDTTRAAVNLIFSGAVERFPRIRFVLAHAGGLVPYFAWRLSVAPMIDSRMEQLSREEIYRRLARFWYDTALSPSAETFQCLSAVASPDRLVFGSDWPFANSRVVAEARKTYEAVPLTPAQRSAIDRHNALALFPRFCDKTSGEAA